MMCALLASHAHARIRLFLFLFLLLLVLLLMLVLLLLSSTRDLCTLGHHATEKRRVRQRCHCR
jgi:hypothetical protein